MENSKKYSLNKTDGIGILKVLGFIVASAAITGMIDLLTQVDFGDYAYLVPFINLLLVTAQKFVQEKKDV